jgi:hypothetical protein
MSGTPKQMVDLETIKTALKKLNYPIPAELTNMLRDQMIDIETFETLWKRLSPPTVEEACSLPTFAGLDHEDPKKFITECKNILANSNPAYWRDQIAAQFRLEPARWWSYEAPYAPSLHDLEQSLIERYENFEILTKLRMKFYEIPQAVGEPADAFITKKKLLATRIAPHIMKAEFNGFCRMWLRDLDENDAANDMTAGDAAEEFPPQKTRDLLHSQELIEGREPDFQTGRDDEHAGQVDIEPIGDRESYQRAQPPLKRERGEMTTVALPRGDAPAVSAERSGKKLDDDFQLPPAETTAEKYPQHQGKLALSAALPSEPGPVSGQLPKVVAVISPSRPSTAASTTTTTIRSSTSTV